MLKVNEEKMIADYLALVDKQDKGYAATEVDANVFAQTHGYNEKKTAELVAFLRELSKGGLSVIEQHKLEHLSEYIEEVPDETAKEAEQELEAATEAVASPNGVNPATVNVH